MKKILLSALILSAASLAFAEQKTTTFELSKGDTWGVSDPEASAGVELVSKTNTTSSITADDITLKVEVGTANYCRLWNASNVITFRPYNGNILTFSAKGYNITKIEFVPESDKTTYCNFEVTDGTWEVPVWTGSASSVVFNANGTSRLISATVTYESAASSDEPTDLVESFVAIDKDGISDVFANATSDGAKSIVTFGTDHMDVEAVGGRTPKDVKLAKTETFTDWTAGWNEPTWKASNTNLRDLKYGADSIYFYYIQGTGNPAVAIDVDEPSEKDDSLVYKAKYTFYEADGSLGMPVMGLYYKFMPKSAGTLKVQVWSNKGNRNTFVVKESTMQPISFTKEGYVNGMNQSVQIAGKSQATEADTLYTANEKRFLTNEQIDSIHHAMKTTYVYDTIWNATRDTVVELVKTDSIDNAPYVIAGGNQAFWGWLTFDVEAGENYWLFQHSSQIGFASYEFTTDGETGIENVADKRNVNDCGSCFDLSGRRVNVRKAGSLYIQNGRKILVR